MQGSEARAEAVVPPEGAYFITGAAGFIGSHVVRRLRDAGCPVIAADVAPVAAEPGVTSASVDITRPSTVRTALARGDVTYGIHLAAKVGDWGDRADYERINVDGARDVLEALAAAGARRIVHISSIAAMGFDPGFDAGPEIAPVPEGDPYSSTKAKGELAALGLAARGAPIVVIRPGDVIGPGSEPWVKRPIRMMKAHQMVLVDGGEGHLAHVYVDNLIDAIFLALRAERAVGRVYVVTDAEQGTTFRAYFKELARIARVPAPRVEVSKETALTMAAGVEAAARRLGFVPPITQTAVRFVTKRCSYSNAAAARDLGYAPRVSLREGLDRIAAAYGVGAG